MPGNAGVDHGRRIGELFQAHNDALLRFLICRLKVTQEAKEVAQEAYVRLLQLDSGEGTSYLRALLFKIASNLAKDRLRNAARHERIEQLEFFVLAESAPSPESGVAAQQALEHVFGIINELPPKCRYAFLMNRFYGRELPEIALLMGLTERMVRIYVERAVVFCRERLFASGERDD